MLLGHDVRVVKSLHTGLDGEGEFDIVFLVHALHTDLVVAVMERREVVTHLLHVMHGLDFLSLRVRDRQH